MVRAGTLALEVMYVGGSQFKAFRAGSLGVEVLYQETPPASTPHTGPYDVLSHGRRRVELTRTITPVTLNVTSATTVRFTPTFTGGTVQISWGDGTPIETLTSGSEASHTYGTAYTGPIVFYPNAATVTQFVSPEGLWSFTTTELTAAFPGLTTLNVTATGNTISGDVTNLPTGITYLRVWGSNTISGDVTNLPTGITYLYVLGSNTISGDVTNLPTGLTYLSVWGSNTISGDVTNLPTGITTLIVWGSNTISGDVTNLPTGITTLIVWGSNTLSGDVTNLPTGLTILRVLGSNTLSGDVTNLPTGLTYLDVQGSNTIGYAGSAYGFAALNRLFQMSGTGGTGLTSTEVDDLLIDINTAALTPVSEKQITITGNAAARTSASDAAVTALQGRGWTVTTN